MRHDPATCPRCTFITADAASGHRAAAIRLCPEGRAASERTMSEARATNPEIAKLHAMLGRR